MFSIVCNKCNDNKNKIKILRGHSGEIEELECECGNVLEVEKGYLSVIFSNEIKEGE